MKGFFDPLPIKRMPSDAKWCADCGVKPPESRVVSVHPTQHKTDLCSKCFEIWAVQAIAAQRFFK